VISVKKVPIMKNKSLGEDEKYNDHEEQSGNSSSDNEPSTSSISWFRVCSKPSYGRRGRKGPVLDQ